MVNMNPGTYTQNSHSIASNSLDKIIIQGMATNKGEIIFDGKNAVVCGYLICDFPRQTLPRKKKKKKKKIPKTTLKNNVFHLSFFFL